MNIMVWRRLRHRICSFRTLMWWGALALITWVVLVIVERPEGNGTAQEQQEALVEDLVSAGIQSNIRKSFRFRVVNQRGQPVPGVAIVGAGDIKRVDCEMRRGRISAALPEA